MKKEKFLDSIQNLCVCIGVILIIVFAVDIIYLFTSCQKNFQGINGFYYIARLIIELLFIVTSFKIANYILSIRSKEEKFEDTNNE